MELCLAPRGKALLVTVAMIVAVGVFSLFTLQKFENVEFERTDEIETSLKYFHTNGRAKQLNNRLLSYVRNKSEKIVCGSKQILCSNSGTVTITFVELSQIETFQNWFISANRSGITNIVVVTFSSTTETHLKMLDFDVYVEDIFVTDEKLTETMKHKLESRKVAIITEILEAGMAVLHSGVDVVFLKNPFPYFMCADCDFEIRNGGTNRIKPNFDFSLFRPVNATINLLKGLTHHMQTEEKYRFSSLFIKTVTGKTRNKYYFNMLDFKQFAGTTNIQTFYHKNGFMRYTKHKYGERLALPFDEDKMVTFHVTWNKMSPTHQYIFKELGLWSVDTYGYYTNPSRKYLLYGNNDQGNGSSNPLLDAMTFDCALVLSKKLHRTLILPKFHCRKGERQLGCTLLSLKNVERFDLRYAYQYREHSFLTNPLVPKSILKSQSPLLFVPGPYDTIFPPGKVPKGENVKLLEAVIPMKGPTFEELQAWFKDFQNFSVIRFYNLYFACSTMKMNAFCC